MRLVTGAIVILFVAAPWYIAVGLKTDWEWWHLFFYKHHFSRATSTMHNAGGHFFYYIPAFWFNSFPWSIFFIPVCIDMVRRMRRGAARSAHYDGLLLMLCWSVVVMVTFSMSATKFPSYIAPMFPAAAVLYANFWHYWSKNEELCAAYWTPITLTVLAAVGVLMFLAFQYAIPIRFPGMFPGVEVLSYVGFIPVAIAGFGLSRVSPTFFRKTIAIQFMVFLMVVFFIGAPFASKYQQYRELFAAVKEENDNQEMPPIASVNCFAYSWVFYSGGPIKKITPDRIDDFFTETNNRGVILMREADYETMQEKTPDDSLHVIKSIPYFGRKFNVVTFTKTDKHQ
jgi:4-amino-4-deoxy-L-arabinose transferase-like glycosyltransferase